MQNMQLVIDLIKETINVFRKDSGIDQTALKNREKAVIVNAFKDGHSLPFLLERLSLSKSSYYYQETVLRREYKYRNIRKKITELFYETKGCYGYRRIYGLLEREGIHLSEKIIRRIMREAGLEVSVKKRRKYSSYQGEISPSVSNELQRDFYADKPNKKWLTYITEFAIPAVKVYLSSIRDCFDGMVSYWTIGTPPAASLVNGTLDQAISGLGEG